MKERTLFDPRIGFTIRNLTVKDSDWYKCKIKKDDKEQEVNYILAVHRKYDRRRMLIYVHMPIQSLKFCDEPAAQLTVPFTENQNYSRSEERAVRAENS